MPCAANTPANGASISGLNLFTLPGSTSVDVSLLPAGLSSFSEHDVRPRIIVRASIHSMKIDFFIVVIVINCNICNISVANIHIFSKIRNNLC